MGCGQATLIFGPATSSSTTSRGCWDECCLPDSQARALSRSPVDGEDVADIATRRRPSQGMSWVDAAGPEIISYADLVGSARWRSAGGPRVVNLPPSLTLLAGDVVGLLVRDVMLTPPTEGLMDELLVSHEAPRGNGCRRLALKSADSLGKKYASELDRHFANLQR